MSALSLTDPYLGFGALALFFFCSTITLYHALMPDKKKEVLIEGQCDEAYEAVRESFRRNFSEGWEAEGAAFAVYKNGKLIVDLWGGFSEKKYKRPWREETLSTIFSTTKSITAMCFAVQIERGLCSYDDLVTEYWPEYGKNGKEKTTIKMILQHQAGLPYFDKALTLEDVLNEHQMDAIIENEKPKVEIGKLTAYHPLTFGWLSDSVFRRIDPQRRSISQFFKEEIQEKHNIDVYIGDCQSEEFRIATLRPYSVKQIIREIGYDKVVGIVGIHYHNPRGNFYKAMKNVTHFGKDFTMYNNPDLRICGQAAVNGVATARGLAKAHLVFSEGHLVGPETLEAIKTPEIVDEYDHSIGERCHKGKGWMYWKGPKGNWQFGHSGIGGQNVRVDLENGLVYSYICNGLKAGTGGHCFTFKRLEKKLFECFDKEKPSESN